MLSKFQELFDEGWQPVGELGPACIQLRYFKSNDPVGAFGVIMMIIFVFASMGLGLLLIPFILPKSWKYQMIGFQVTLRRPRRLEFSTPNVFKSDPSAVFTNDPQSEGKICPKCGEFNSPNTTFCNNCSEHLKDVKIQEPTKDPTHLIRSNYKVCTTCYKKNPINFEYCEYCQSKL